ATSQATASPPIAPATPEAAASLTSKSATLAPPAASARAVAAPSPEPPPVTIAACPSIRIAEPPRRERGYIADRRRLANAPAAPRHPANGARASSGFPHAVQSARHGGEARSVRRAGRAVAGRG